MRCTAKNPRLWHRLPLAIGFLHRVSLFSTLRPPVTELSLSRCKSEKYLKTFTPLIPGRASEDTEVVQHLVTKKDARPFGGNMVNRFRPGVRISLVAVSFLLLLFAQTATAQFNAQLSGTVSDS